MSRWRNSKKTKEWKKSCIERDGGKCVLTGISKNLEVHHINDASYHPEQRYDINNGVTLYKYVHFIFHILVMGGYRKKCTRKHWNRFVRLFKYINLLFEAMQKQKTPVL